MNHIKILNFGVTDDDGDCFNRDNVTFDDMVPVCARDRYNRLGKRTVMTSKEGLFISLTEGEIEEYKGYYPSIMYTGITDDNIEIKAVILTVSPNTDKTIQPI